MKISISSLQIFSHSLCHLKTWHSWGYFSKNNRTGTFKNFISELVYSNNEHLWNDKKNLQLFNQHMFQTLKNFQEWKRMFDINFSNYLSIVEPFLCTPFHFYGALLIFIIFIKLKSHFLSLPQWLWHLNVRINFFTSLCAWIEWIHFQLSRSSYISDHCALQKNFIFFRTSFISINAS